MYKIKWTDFGVKLNLHIYKTVKDFKNSSLTDIAAANVCIMKKSRVLYHVSERRYFNFCPGRFSEIVAILTAPAVCKNGNCTSLSGTPEVHLTYGAEFLEASSLVGAFLILIV